MIIEYYDPSVDRSFCVSHQLDRLYVFVHDDFLLWSTVPTLIGELQSTKEAQRTAFVPRFHEWPEVALVSVAKRFVQDIEALPKDYLDSVAQFMAYVHSSVNEMSVQYLMVSDIFG